MNVSQLRPGLFAQSSLKITQESGSSKDADFLTFKLLNKRARLRLSNSPLDLESIPARAELFTIAVSKPWFAAAIHKDGAYHIIASPLSQLREEAVALTEESSEVAFHATNTLSLPGPISVITFAQHDTRLIVGLANGAICVYDCGGLFNGYPLPPSPLHTFETSPCPIMSISPNPEGIPELIAVCRESRSKPGSQAVEILNLADASLTGMWTAGPDLETVPSSISWSPKGKQIALGFRNGGIATYIPGDTSAPKFIIPPPQTLQNHSVLGLTWLSNTVYHAIYVSNENPAADAEQAHYIITADAKTNSANYAHMNSPYLPFPGIRVPAPFSSVFRDWSPAKFLVIAGDSASSDLGVLTCTENWHHVSLDEGSAPTLPLTTDLEDTVLIGLQVDTTSSSPYAYAGASGVSIDLPPPPTLYAYVSDGTVQAWHIINTSGAAYSAPVTTPLAPAMHTTNSVAMFDGTTNSTTSTPVARPLRSDQDMDTGLASQKTEPSSGLSFGGMSLGAPSTTPSNDRPSSIFGSVSSGSTPATTTSTSPFGSAIAVSQGFGAFGGASTTPASPFTTPKSTASAFGSGGFGQSAFGTVSPTPSAFGQATSAGQSAFGQSGFGQSTAGNSAFGSPAPATPAGNSAFGQSTFSKPGTTGGGFGQSAFGQPSAFASKPPPAGTAAPMSSPFGGGSGSGGFASFAGTGVAGLGVQPTSIDSTSGASPGSTTSAFGGATTTPKAERPVSAFAAAVGSTTPGESPQSSPFVNTSTAPPVNAFAGLRTQPNVFKPGAGFGAFGSSSTQTSTTSSPFQSASSTPSAFASAFGGGSAFKSADGQGAEKSSTPGASVFGSSSAVGSISPFGKTSSSGSQPTASEPRKSAFASPSPFAPKPASSAFTSTTPPTTPKEPATGGFGAFAGSSSAFGNASEGEKPASFTDLMRGDKSAGALKPNTEAQPEDTNTSKPEEEPDSKLGLEESISGLSHLSESFEKIDHESASQKGDDPDAEGDSYDSEEFSGEEDDDGRPFTPPPDGEEEEEEEDEEDADEGSVLSEEEDAESEGDHSAEEQTDATVEGKRTDELQTPASPVSPSTSVVDVTRSKAPPDESTSSSKPAASSTSGPPSLFAAPLASRLPFSFSTTPPGTPAQDAPAKVPSSDTAPEKPTLFGKATTKPLRSSPLASGQVINSGNQSTDATAKPPVIDRARTELPIPTTSRPPLALPNKPNSSTLPFAVGPPASGPSPSAFVPGSFTSPFSLGSKPVPTLSGAKSDTVPAPTFPSFAPKPGALPGFMVSPLAPSPAPPSAAPAGFPSLKPTAAPQSSVSPSPAFSLSKFTPQSPPAAPVSAPALSGIELACHELLTSVTTAFDELAHRLPQSSGRNGSGEDAFAMDDVRRLDALLTKQHDEVDELRVSQASFKRYVEHFDRDLLKVATKKEEIVRFNKAKTDQGFARMLKSRTLGPDHVEMQTQLRRDIRAIRDRVKKLELYVEGGKKRLAHVSKNKAVLKASSLEIVNRTMNNIEAAIVREREDITSLSRRVGRLNLRDPSIAREDSPAPIEASLPLVVREASVAAMAAAALNAERSALRLKRALLSARKEPLLTTSSAPILVTTTKNAEAVAPNASRPPVAPGTPPPMTFPSFRLPAAPSTPFSAGILDFPTPPPIPMSFNLPSGPDDSFSVLADSQSSSFGPRRGGGNPKHHAKSVGLKKSPSPAPTTAQKFEWGPLPAMTTAPSLAFDLRPKAPPS